MARVPTVEGPPLHERMRALVTEMENTTSLPKMAAQYEQAKHLLRFAATVVEGEQRDATRALDEVQGALAIVRAMFSGNRVTCQYCGEEIE